MGPSRFKLITGAILSLTLLVFAPYRCFSQSRGGPDESSVASEPTVKTASSHTIPRAQPLRVSVDLVFIPVTVTDELNRPQTNLRREDFNVYEGDQAQQIRYFSSEDSP